MNLGVICDVTRGRVGDWGGACIFASYSFRQVTSGKLCCCVESLYRTVEAFSEWEVGS